MSLKDLQFAVSTSPTAVSISWKSETWTWSEIVEKFTSARVTPETYKQFVSYPKEVQGRIKDVGAFVGGELFGSRRTKSAMGDRSLLALDVDFGEESFPMQFESIIGCAHIIHGTHKHNPKAGVYRYRILIPLSEPVDGERYEAIARKVAEFTGIDLYDKTTFQPERCMFLPSVSSDVEYYCKVVDGEALDVEEYLGMYDDWSNTQEWAYHKDEKGEARILAKEQADPTLKEGVVGDFCRAYSISEVIEAYLSDVYEPTEDKDRYTYMGGSTSGGMITFDDTFAYSYHHNDPIQGRHVYNAYDLVRIHKFGKLDKDGSSKASTAEMNDLVQRDAKVAEMRTHRLMGSNHSEKVEDELNGLGDLINGEAEEVELDFDFDKNGALKPNAKNIELIFLADKDLKGLIAKNEFSQKTVLTRPVFWRDINSNPDLNDTDLSYIRSLIDKKYGITSPFKIQDAVLMESERNSFHPVRNYLASLVWDGVPRVDTLLIDFMKAEDNVYTREAIRIMLVGAVRRIFKAGYKFDSMLVLQSGQGAGKSKLISLLGGDWFSDSLSTMEGKAAYEQLPGAWIFEVAELSAMKRGEVESIKNFITKTEDTFRPAYGRFTVSFKRQCVFFGTTNQYDFLKDSTGGRRFLPVQVMANERTGDLFKPEMKEYIKQVWAEAVAMHYQGVSTLLSPEAEEIANGARDEHLEVDTRVEDVERYLDMRVPIDWNDMSSAERKMYYDNYDEDLTPATYVRMDFAPTNALMEEVFGLNAEKRTNQQSRAISNIMNALGDEWVRSRRRSKAYGNARGYVRKGSDLDLFG
ncbi:hypothetical protein BM127P2_00037 [Phocaeicola phage BM127P2]|nr:hypothetical protein BM127P1_00022 [Phocaeicola phage BM127P1]WAX08316.1 hypothetical protein BM127P2_00037 [Phocaeicola phage BM127P2]WAX08331.1 hypothetical protein BM127P3_00005 [Phocaeicola phage BM127P3]WAX08410.1 hypothetical protein BM127P4_00037 [Phocaeicola phage BM127P4]